MLTEAAVVDYLLDLDIVSADDVVSRGLTVTDLSRRHRNFAVATRLGGRAFVKQRDVRRSVDTLAHEANVYNLLWRIGGEFADTYIARSRTFDQGRGVLVLEHLDGAEPISLIDSRRANMAVAAAGELGRALALLHQVDVDSSCDCFALAPWVLSAARPDWGALAQLSAASISALQIAQQSPVIHTGLLDLASSADSDRSLIHGDMRLENCLVRSDQDNELQRLYLVDWELAGIGDARHDVGAILADYLRMWIRSMPAAASFTVGDSLRLATLPLASILPSIDGFWTEYQAHKTRHKRGPAFVTGSLRWAGARLVQSAIESAQESPALSSTVVMLLQLAENILGDPERTARLIGVQ